MFSALLSLSFGANLENLVPPYHPDLNGNVGNWVFAGNVVVFEDQILLSPPVQNKFGCAWNGFELPSDNWGLRSSFRIHKGTGGGGFAIWFVEDYGSYGTVHGGPDAFRGIMVSATVLEHPENNTHELLFHVIENNGGTRINISEIKPDYRMYFHHRFFLPIDISFVDGEIIVKSNGDNKRPEEVCRKVLTRSLKNCYFGITAASEEMTSRVDLNKIEFDMKQESKHRDAYFDKKQVSGDVPVKQSTLLRNPLLREMAIEMENLNGKYKGEVSTARHLLDIMASMNEVSFEVASFHELNDFIVDTILPYSAKWNRRTIKIVEGVRNVKDIMGATWNYTDMILESFNSTLKRNLIKTSTNIMSLSQELLGVDGSDEDSTIVIDLSEQTNTIEVGISYIFMIEFIVLIIYFVMKKATIKN